MHDWTSMVGNVKKKVLAKLPAQFPNILEPNHCDTITEIWKVHYDICVLYLLLLNNLVLDILCSFF